MRSSLLFLLLFLSCAPQLVGFKVDSYGRAQVFKDFPVLWSFDCEFPETMKDDVRDGFQYWNDETERTIFVEATDCGVVALIDYDKPRVFVTSIPNFHPRNPELIATTSTGIYNNVPRTAVVRFFGPWLTHPSSGGRASVARHEVGHVLGFEHADSTLCLMYPQMSMEYHRWKPMTACRTEIDMARRHYPKEGP